MCGSCAQLQAAARIASYSLRTAMPGLQQPAPRRVSTLLLLACCALLYWPVKTEEVAADVDAAHLTGALYLQLFSGLEAEVIDVEDSEDIFELDESSSPDWATPPPSTYEAPAHKSSSTYAACDGRFQRTAGMNGISHVEGAAQHASSSGRGIEALEESMRAGMQLSGGRRNSTDSNSSYGDMPTAMAEQVRMLPSST